MSSGKAYFSLLLIVAGIAGLDAVVLTSSRSLSRIARAQIDAVLGKQIEYTGLTCTVSGDLDLTGVGFYLKKEHLKVLSVDRVHIEFAWRNGTVVAREVELQRPRFFISDRILEALEAETAAPEGPAPTGSGGGGATKIGSHHLPKILCHGGAVEVAYSELLAWDAPQVVEIGEISMVPVQDYQYFVGGRLTGKIFGQWNVAGSVDVSTGHHDLTIRSTGVTLGPSVRGILSPKAQPIWDLFKPDGRADVDIRFHQAEGRPFSFLATLHPVDVSLEYINFPYRVEHVSGEIDFRGDAIEVKHLEGRTGPFKAQLDGRVGGYESDAEIALRLEVEAMPIDEKLRKALPAGARKVYDRFAPRGLGDVRGRIRREAGRDKPVRYPLDCTFRDAAARFEGFPYGIDKLNGEIRIDATEVTVKSLRGTHGDARMSFNGTVGNIDGDPTIDLTIYARAIPLDIELKQALPPRMQRLWDDFQPTGTVDASWRVTKASGADEKNAGTITAKNCRVVYREVPLPVSEVAGQLRIEHDGVRIDHVAGKLENGTVEVNGTWKEVAEGYDLDLKIDHRGAVINDRYKAAMPKQISNMLTSLRVSGNADYAATLTIQDRKGEWVKNSAAVQLLMSQGVMDTEFPITDIEGEINVIIDAPAGKLTGSGSLSLRQARFKKKKVTELHCPIFYINGMRVTFPLLQGRAYGGNINGSFWLDGDTTELGGEFAADRVELRDYVQDTDRYSRRDMSGMTAVTVRNLHGFGNKPETLTGEGTLTISDGHLQEVPGLVSMLSGETNFTTCRADFSIGNRKFRIRKPNVLAFETKASGVYAYGWMDFDLNYSFRAWSTTAPFFSLFILKPFALLFDGLKAPFKVQVKGSLMDPDQGAATEKDLDKMDKDEEEKDK